MSKDMMFFIDYDPETGDYPGYSYAWITTVNSWHKTKCIAADELRTRDVIEAYPDFAGVDDMEGHFEFCMSHEELQTHLLAIGMILGDNRAKDW